MRKNSHVSLEKFLQKGTKVEMKFETWSLKVWTWPSLLLYSWLPFLWPTNKEIDSGNKYGKTQNQKLFSSWNPYKYIILAQMSFQECNIWSWYLLIRKLLFSHNSYFVSKDNKINYGIYQSSSLSSVWKNSKVRVRSITNTDNSDGCPPQELGASERILGLVRLSNVRLLKNCIP